MMMSFDNLYEWPWSRKIIFLAIIFTIIFYLGVWFDIYSLKDELQKSRNQEVVLKRQLDSSLEKVVIGFNDVSSLTKYQFDLQNWQNTLVQYKDLPELLNQILQIGQANNISFVLFAPQEKIVARGQYVNVPIKVIAVGSFHQMAVTFSQIANIKTIVSIGKFVMSNTNKPDVLGADLAKKATSENLLTAEFMLELYYIDKSIKPAEPANPKDKKTPAGTKTTPAEIKAQNGIKP